MKPHSIARRAALMAGLTALFSVSACSSLLGSSAPPARFFLLERPQTMPAPTPMPALVLAAPTGPRLLLSLPQAAAGFDSQRIIYRQAGGEFSGDAKGAAAAPLSYFARSEWADTPARMLSPLLLQALDGAVLFRAVAAMPGAATGDWRLDTLVVRLQQEFDGPRSVARLTLRASLVDNTSRQVLAVREFDQRVPANSQDAAGGVAAANQAVQQVLQTLVAFCKETVAQAWRPVTTVSTAVGHHFLLGSTLLPMTPPTTAPPTVPAVLPPVRIAPAAPPITAPVAVF